MPLKKLWNALRGRSTPSPDHDSMPADTAESPQGRTGNAAGRPRKSSGRKSPATKRSLFGGGPHAGLCKQLKSVSAATVLEIGVDDGQRAAAIVRTLAKKLAAKKGTDPKIKKGTDPTAKKGTDPKTKKGTDPTAKTGTGPKAASADVVEYLAIDPFELDDQFENGHPNLKQFHRQLRAQQIRARLFPQEIAPGLVQVSHVVGTVDLVIIGAQPDKWQIPQVQSALLRVCHPGTVVFWLDGETWRRLDLAVQAVGRAA